MKLVVRRLTSEWGEGVGRGIKPDVSDGASWLQRGRLAGGEAAPWKTPGGDVDTASDWGRGAGIASEGEVVREGERVCLDLTAVVRDFVSGKLPNCGLLIESSGGSATFVSGDAILEQVDWRPRLALVVTGIRPLPAQAAVKAEDRIYVLSKAEGIGRFRQDVAVIPGGGTGRSATVAFKDEGLVLPAAGAPWRLDVRRTWGADLEVAVKLDADSDSGVRVSVDFGGALGESRIEGLQLRAGGGGVFTAFLPLRSNERSAAPEALWVSSNSGSSLVAKVWPGKGDCDVRFTKRGPVLRLEANGLLLAETILSERDERELAGRTVRLVLGGGHRTGSPPPPPTAATLPDMVIKEFRSGKLR
jgi:hypothetical protein